MERGRDRALQEDTGDVGEVLNGEDGKAIVSNDDWDGREANQEAVLEGLFPHELIETFKVLGLNIASSSLFTEEVICDKV